MGYIYKSWHGHVTEWLIAYSWEEPHVEFGLRYSTNEPMSIQLSQEVVGWLDVAKTLTEYPSLRPKTDVYTNPDGRSELLLCLYGTIPTQFSGAIYRIPIEFWIPKPYPQLSPIPIVRPTESMLVSPSNYVDQNGVCFHPYLYNWSPANNIYALIGVLSEAFSKKPPVYAKPPDYDARNHPHGPPEYQRYNSSPQSQPQSPQQPQPQSIAPNSNSTPPLPPKPPKSFIEPQPQYAAHHQNQVPSSSTEHDLSQYQQQRQAQAQPPLAEPLRGPPPAGESLRSPQPSTEPLRVQQTPPHQVHPEPRPMQLMDMETTGPVQQEQPQRPPNPEKMQAIEHLEQQLERVSKNLNDEASQDDEALKYTEQTLSWMEGQIDAQTRELDNIKSGCHANEAILTEKIDTARRVINDSKSRQKPNVDDILCAENAVYNQLYQLVAEDHAIDDTMYILGKSLDKDRVQLDPFLKHTRTLAREQFLKRALINKISSQVGLD
ncbi:hypothetical protein TRICI_001598 [Trichomonascus ciferrii]|uniref:UEV domain-containing protein n=1 Tax=Trichomonascus ciferrii TaxID=44093 RepID=A0A642VAD9_9ASCO|nr:hypothetical protein TRICI_001598 [Trichomonascus ciferrii]